MNPSTAVPSRILHPTKGFAVGREHFDSTMTLRFLDGKWFISRWRDGIPERQMREISHETARVLTEVMKTISADVAMSNHLLYCEAREHWLRQSHRNAITAQQAELLAAGKAVRKAKAALS